MDDDRFDALTRLLRATYARRGALRALGGVVAGGAAVSQLDDAAAKRCGPSRRKKKNGTCK
jgi:hypothetical protein